MLGNVFEWCSDYYGDYTSSSQSNPQGSSTGSHRVIRGGSWFTGAWYCRVSTRDGNSADFRHYYLGLRLAL